MHSILSLEERVDKVSAEQKEVKIYLNMCYAIYDILVKNPVENARLIQETVDWVDHWAVELDRIDAEIDAIGVELGERN